MCQPAVRCYTFYCAVYSLGAISNLEGNSVQERTKTILRKVMNDLI